MVAHTDIDLSVTLWREGIADSALCGAIQADRYHSPEDYYVSVAVVDLFGQSPDDEAIDSQLLFGERVKLLCLSPRYPSFAIVQNYTDHYVGYVAHDALRPLDASYTPTHRIINPQTPVFRSTNIKSRPQTILSIGSLVQMCDNDGILAKISFGNGFAWVSLHHLRAIDEASGDFVADAKRFLHLPYLWGGRSGFGLDCSAFIQMSLGVNGHDTPRDSHQLQESLGDDISHFLVAAHKGDYRELRHGDMIFWPGHCGIICDGLQLLHANAGSMSVACKPLGDEIARILEREQLAPCAIKRLATYHS
ncbi:MAG: NlpC/P60 family protein [Pseudomonadota bacterium]